MITKSPDEINALAARIHVLNRKWWPENIEDRNKGEICILIISEITECMEGERKDLMDDKLLHRKMAEVEMADTAIRVLDVMGAFKYEYNYDGRIRVDWTDNKAENLYGLLSILCVSPFMGVSAKSIFSALLANIEEYCRRYGYDLWGALEEKLEYNKHREDHKTEVRAMPGGKKW